AKAGLGTRKNTVGQRPKRRIQNRALAWRMPISKPLAYRPKQFDVDKGHSDLQRVRHSRPIRVAKKLVAHVPAGFQTRQPGTGRFDPRDVPFDGKRAFELFPTFASEMDVQYLGELPWHKQSSPQQVGARVAP